jgi:hypothetical protein
MSDNDITYAHPPYTPMISLRHELGIMFGFAAACILTVVVYYIFWQGKTIFFHPRQLQLHFTKLKTQPRNDAPPPATMLAAKTCERAASITNEADTTTER